MEMIKIAPDIEEIENPNERQLAVEFNGMTIIVWMHKPYDVENAKICLQQAIGLASRPHHIYNNLNLCIKCDVTVYNENGDMVYHSW